MRILFVTDHMYLPHRAGGAESSTHDLALALKEAGVAVSVLAAAPQVSARRLYDRLLRKTLRRRPPSVDHVMGYPVFRSTEPAVAVHAVVERVRPNAAVVNSGEYTTLARACVSAGLPTIVYLRDVEHPDVSARLPKEPDVAYISNSLFNARRWAAIAGLKPFVVPPLVRPERFKTDTTRRRVLFVNPVPEKGVDLAFRLADARRDIPFDFVECWPLDEQRRQRLLARARATPNVAWHPVQSDPRHLYRHARLLLVPSVWEESWGRVVTEAHINAIPVLASNRGGLAESVGPGGILIEHGSPLERWRTALSRLWDDEETYWALVRAAQQHSERQDIQPRVLIENFLEIVERHVIRSTVGSIA